MTAAVLPVQPAFRTRAQFRSELRAGLEAAVRLATVPLEEIAVDPEAETQPELSPAIGAIPVLTRKAIDEALELVLSGQIPPPSEREAEVRTSAFLTVWAKCPNCGIHLVIPMSVEPSLTLNADGNGELKLKAKSKGRIHACHQLTLDEPEGQLRAFAADSAEPEAGDEYSAGSEVEDESDPADGPAHDDDSDEAELERAHVSPLRADPDAPSLAPALGDLLTVAGVDLRITGLGTNGDVFAKAGKTQWTGHRDELAWSESLGRWTLAEPEA